MARKVLALLGTWF